MSSPVHCVLPKELSPHVGSRVFKSETFPLLVSILSDCFDRSLRKKVISSPADLVTALKCLILSCFQRRQRCDLLAW